MGRQLLCVLAALASASAIAACGKSSQRQITQIGLPVHTSAGSAGALALVTKNTSRLGGGDPATDAAAVALAVYPGLTPASRPRAVVLADERDWPAALAASVLAAAPLGAPLLYADGSRLPAVTVQALRALHPLGAPSLGGAQVIRIGTVAPLPGAYRVVTVTAAGGAAAAAAAVQRLALTAQGTRAHQVIVLSETAQAALQMPAAGLAAESGAPILFAAPTSVPAPTALALDALGHPTLYLLGAQSLGSRARAALAQHGRVSAIGGGEAANAVENAIAVARFAEGSFGWGVREAGHGLAFLNDSRPLDAPAAAPLSAHGDYAPPLLLAAASAIPAALTHYLSDIEPGYTATISPVREVYNHGWLIGDERAISARVQAEIDAILEVAPRTSATSAAPPE